MLDIVKFKTAARDSRGGFFVVVFFKKFAYSILQRINHHNTLVIVPC
ncbi:hypothetical protein NMS_1296 [Nonlabens marinus S1-08]|uniref:Uncharacterized protein n=1 Tax=Nonlabens marinus S1-08 TaxID=1454201 RepID=W8VQX2_9FLAO|nr:hypothetical protein NMS_1296 [Nonlabens marinus S1-08]